MYKFNMACDSFLYVREMANDSYKGALILNLVLLAMDHQL